MRTEPAPSVPIWMQPRLSAAQEAAPAEEPPGPVAMSQGLRVMPESGESPTPFQPYSGMVVLPRKTQPASRSRAAAGASSAKGASEATAEPRRIGQPATPILSLIVTGTPSSGPSASPLSVARLGGLAPSPASTASSRTTKALISGSKRSIRASASFATSTGESLRAGEERAEFGGGKRGDGRHGVNPSDAVVRRTPRPLQSGLHAQLSGVARQAALSRTLAPATMSSSVAELGWIMREPADRGDEDHGGRAQPRHHLRIVAGARDHAPDRQAELGGAALDRRRSAPR